MKLGTSQRLYWWLLAGSVTLVILLYIAPISTRLSRAVTVLLVISFPCLCLAMLWRARVLRYLCDILAILLSSVLWLPGRNYNKADLQSSYCNWLSSYNGVRYRWGGEGRFGIDCSGLIRRGIINASFSQALLTWNPRLFRYGVKVWWQDSTAKEMLRGYHGYAIPKKSYPSINAIPSQDLEKGDIAVTTDGVHVLAFIGNNQWVEADPSVYSVITVNTPTKRNGWFLRPVTLVRWASL
jgi:hypothetical protein